MSRSGGAFLFLKSALGHGRMNRDLENVIRQALADAQAAGRDDLAQTELAVRAVRQEWSGMTFSVALTAVNRVLPLRQPARKAARR